MIKRLKKKLYNGRFKGLFATDGTLSQKAARSGVWVFGSFLFSKVLFFVRTIILVRLLAPEDFGLMGICYVAIGALAVFTETGFNMAVIQRKEHDDDILNTAWVISVLRGLVLFLFLFLGAPFIANFYDNAQILPILKVIAFSFLFYGFSNIGLILFNKDLNFKKKVFFDQLGTVFSIIVTVILAFMLRNVWALVLGHILGSAIGVGLSYFVHPYRPKFKFKVNIAKELFGFGKHVFVAGVLIFLITQGDDALVGKVLGMGALGFYVLAYSLSNMPATSITHVISSVSFPAYSKLQDDYDRLGSAYVKILRFTALLSIPLAGFIFILGPDFVKFVYGQEWTPMIPALLIMCFLGLFRSLVSTIGPVFMAIGKPYISNKIIFGQLIVLAVSIYPLTELYGIAGAALSGMLCYLYSLILHYIKLSKMIDYIKSNAPKTITLPFIMTIATILIVFIGKSFLYSINSITSLIIYSILSLVVYFSGTLLIDKQNITILKELIRQKNV
jgi:O-antigen/teichoic acid export membrane protein